ncbi:class F sortase [Cellulomonas edaphi]|uniref:Class F sortase n=1 Tax=Cellulomonas edaphi TaxID=3053468 RepID=A0ABT7S301_9CELL|nr:class F sortase [Cellulomons edaphi]MDM7829991.1 class F sortase [Cellulomons edaphi]
MRDATAPAPVAIPGSPPARLTVASLDLRMPVVPVGVADDGTMDIPPRATDAGWYRFGPAPGAPGNTVIAAHVDSWVTGIGPFSRLRDVRTGASVVVESKDGATHRYRVVSVRKIPKDEAPVDQWFAREGDPRLVLVTCGGAWQPEIRHYADNVVVVAEPTGA